MPRAARPSMTVTAMAPGDGPRRGEDLNVHLGQAVINNRLDAIRSLVQAGADPNAAYVDGRPLLHVAAHNAPQAVDVLLELGADVNRPGPDGLTLLGAAVGTSERSLRLLDHWFARGASLAHPANRFALHSAAFFGDQEVVELLLNHGADATIRNKSGQTAADLAISRRHHKAGERLQRAFVEATVAQERAALQDVANAIAPAPPTPGPGGPGGRSRRL